MANNSTRINLQLNITKLFNTIKANPALIGYKSTKTNEAYINLVCWINPEIDEYNNDISVQLSVPEKLEPKPEKNIYLGNGKTEAAFKEIKRRKELAESKIEAKPVMQVEIEVNGEKAVIDDLPW